MAKELEPKDGGPDPDEGDDEGATIGPSTAELPEGVEAPEPEEAPEPATTIRPRATRVVRFAASQSASAAAESRPRPFVG